MQLVQSREYPRRLPWHKHKLTVETHLEQFASLAALHGGELRQRQPTRHAERLQQASILDARLPAVSVEWLQRAEFVP